MKKLRLITKIVNQIKHKILGAHHRRFQIYCIGAAKTGTTSMASMFSGKYYAEHEPETKKTNQLVIDYLEKNISREEVSRSLINRDRRLNPVR